MSIPTLQDRETVAGMSALYANDRLRRPPMGIVIKEYARLRARLNKIINRARKCRWLETPFDPQIRALTLDGKPSHACGRKSSLRGPQVALALRLTPAPYRLADLVSQTANFGPLGLRDWERGKPRPRSCLLFAAHFACRGQHPATRPCLRH